MNLFEMLTAKEQEICIQLIMGISMPMVAFLHRITTGEVDECRESIIEKLENNLVGCASENFCS